MRNSSRGPLCDITNTSKSSHTTKHSPTLAMVTTVRRRKTTPLTGPPAKFHPSSPLSLPSTTSSCAQRASRRVTRVRKAATAATQQHVRSRSQLKLTPHVKRQSSNALRRASSKLRRQATSALAGLNLPFLAPSSSPLDQAYVSFN